MSRTGVPIGSDGVKQVSNGKKLDLFRMAAACGAVSIAAVIFCAVNLRAQSGIPKFEVDPTWPKPLPERWVTGEIGGVCVDAQDHVFVVQRVNDVGGLEGHPAGLTAES